VNLLLLLLIMLMAMMMRMARAVMMAKMLAAMLLLLLRRLLLPLLPLAMMLAGRRVVTVVGCICRLSRPLRLLLLLFMLQHLRLLRILPPLLRILQRLWLVSRWSTGLCLRVAEVGSTATMVGRCMEGEMWAAIIRRCLEVTTATSIDSTSVNLCCGGERPERSLVTSLTVIYIQALLISSARVLVMS